MLWNTVEVPHLKLYATMFFVKIVFNHFGMDLRGTTPDKESASLR